jgi:uracil-DNA glycosylase
VEGEVSKPYFQELRHFLQQEGETATIFPPKQLVFRALDLCPLDTVKVVVLGQDPYHGEGQAHGLSFSVPRDVSVPPSLRNVFIELEDDLGCPKPCHGNLESWARQGVLLLNTVLTVRANEPNSHQKQGWERFTAAMLRQVLTEQSDVVVLLWGKRAIDSYAAHFSDQESNAPEKKTYDGVAAKDTTARDHTVLTASHPSPLGARKTNQPFIGCRYG